MSAPYTKSQVSPTKYNTEEIFRKTNQEEQAPNSRLKPRNCNPSLVVQSTTKNAKNTSNGDVGPEQGLVSAKASIR